LITATARSKTHEKGTRKKLKINQTEIVIASEVN